MGGAWSRMCSWGGWTEGVGFGEGSVLGEGFLGGMFSLEGWPSLEVCLALWERGRRRLSRRRPLWSWLVIVQVWGRGRW